jgi:acetyl esterase
MGMPAKMPLARVTDIQIHGAVGMLPARVYDPQTAGGPAPVILYFHGGGWVTGNLDTYDASDRALAQGTGAIVVSVQYRLGPESRFPAAQNDANASYAWLLRNAGTIGADPRQIALAGESAGGNLAIDTAIWARDQHLPAPVHQLLVYPVVGTNLNTPSYKETIEAVPLNRTAITWYVGNFTNGPADLMDPRLDVVGAADLHGLPPTTIVSAEIDPLRSEGETLAQKLRSVGVPVEQRTYPGVTHEFFGMGAVVSQAKQAEDFAAMRLKASFMQPMMAPVRQRPARRNAT